MSHGSKKRRLEELQRRSVRVALEAQSSRRNSPHITSCINVHPRCGDQHTDNFLAAFSSRVVQRSKTVATFIVLRCETCLLREGKIRAITAT